MTINPKHHAHKPDTLLINLAQVSLILQHGEHKPETLLINLAQVSLILQHGENKPETKALIPETR